jgi:hypothetical protein
MPYAAKGYVFLDRLDNHHSVVSYQDDLQRLDQMLTANGAPTEATLFVQYVDEGPT